MKPSDFLFCVDYSDPDMAAFCLTSKEYWDENHVLDDCLGEIDCLPDGFANLMEASWEYDGSFEEGAQALSNAGFIFSSDMDRFINHQ